MDIFSFFVKLTHPRRRIGWKETTAYFTGESRIPQRARGGYYPLMNSISSAHDSKEFCIKYYVEDSERVGWYLFYPGPDPNPKEIKGRSIRIRYMKSRHWIFENVSGFGQSDI